MPGRRPLRCDLPLSAPPSGRGGPLGAVARSGRNEDLFAYNLADRAIVSGQFYSLRTNTFFTLVNLFNILRAFSWIAAAAFSEALVLILGWATLCGSLRCATA
jgi:hypothetical protein